MKRTWHEFGGVLRVACQVQWHGCFLDSRMKAFEEENRLLKKMYVEEKFTTEIVAEALEKMW